MNKLLSIADSIETHRDDNKLSLDILYEIVDSQGKIKRLDRRVKDILRIFSESKWLTQCKQDHNVLCLTENYDNFIGAWNSGNHLLPMNQGLRNYPPYADFLECLKNEGEIKIPQRNDKASRRDLGLKIKQNYNITFVAFDTFQAWSVSVGHAYRSPFEGVIYWGGEWDEKQPSLKLFRTACWESYNQCEKTSGYANLGQLAHLVCRKLRISFQAFEMKMNLFVKNFPGKITLAPATIRSEISGNYQIISIRPRNEILSERLIAKLLNIEETKKVRNIMRKGSLWLDYRYLEDGLHVNGKLIKLIRWEK